MENFFRQSFCYVMIMNAVKLIKRSGENTYMQRVTRNIFFC